MATVVEASKVLVNAKDYKVVRFTTELSKTSRGKFYGRIMNGIGYDHMFKYELSNDFKAVWVYVL